MDGLDVLVRVERPVHERLGDARGQRAKDQDPRHARIGVQLPDHGEDVGDLRVVGEVLVGVVAFETLGQPLHVPFVRGRGVIVPDQDRREPRPSPGDPQLPELFVDMLGELFRQLVAVDHRPRHATSFRRRITRARASAGTPVRR